MRVPLFLPFFVLSAYASPQILAKFTLGDKDLSSGAEDGLYRVSYDQLLQVFQAAGQQGQIIGLATKQLALMSSSLDSIPNAVLGPVRSPYGLGGLSPVGLEVRDHSAGGSGPANQTFDSGDTLVFYGQGTSFWKSVPATHPQAQLLPWNFYASPLSFERSYYLAISSNSALSRQVIGPLSGSSGELLSLRRFEKDSLLKDLYYKNSGNPIYDDHESGDEFFWLWQDESQSSVRLWSHLERGNSSAAILDKSPQKAWVDLGFYPDRKRVSGAAPSYEKYIFDSLTRAERYKSISARALVNQSPWSGEVRSLNGWVGEVTSLKAGSNQLDFEFQPNKWEMRFNGLSLAWTGAFDASSGSSNAYYPREQSGLVQYALTVPAKSQILRIDDGEWLGTSITPQGSGFADTVVPNRHWVVVNDSMRTPRISIVQRPAGVVVDLEKGFSNRAENPQNLMICPEYALAECLEYRNYRENQASHSTSVAVVAAEDLYASYQGGQISAGAIREFLRYASSTWASQLRSVTLVGDGHVDQRSVTGKWADVSMPVYSREAMASDDYFAVLDSGAVLRGYSILSADNRPQLALGRIPVQKVGQLKEYLNKVIEFEQSSPGAWGNQLTLLADDAWQSGSHDGIRHLDQSEKLSSLIVENAPWARLQKIYLEDYAADAAGKKFAANRDLVRALSDGRYMVNYFGHGGANVLSDEGLFDHSSLANLGLKPVHSIFTAFSCLVGRFESPQTPSLMEDFVRKTPGGGIATIAALRESESGANSDLAQSFYRNAFSDEVYTLGEALRRAKLKVAAVANAELYALLGDPELNLIHPKPSLGMSGLGDTLSALSQIQIQGQAPGIAEGKVALVVQNQKVPKSWKIQTDAFSYWDNALFEGTNIYSELIPIHNGQFQSSFISPRKLNFGDTAARVIAYAWSNDGKTMQKFEKHQLRLWGTDPKASSIVDTTPPSIEAYPCKTVGRTPLGTDLALSLPLCVEFEVKDNLGLDFASGADEGIDVQWLGEESPWHPDYLEQTGKTALFRVGLENAPTGKKQLRIRALDVLGNQEVKTWNIELLEKQGAKLFDVYNQPNPMRQNTVFHFKTAGLESATFSIRIFDQGGHLIRILENARPGLSSWDGRDNWGQPMANGLYFYKVTSSVPLAEAQFGAKKYQVMSALQRLVISR